MTQRLSIVLAGLAAVSISLATACGGGEEAPAPGRAPGGTVFLRSADLAERHRVVARYASPLSASKTNV